ncbi:hypothetical protein CPAV1605_1354 [seawater metagenome]|uniref:RING-type domain-containing protein n=1 Tax=seawater metagenome TaxID=1561972 RepID=A0A5E8CMA5_9ZZZZ
MQNCAICLDSLNKKHTIVKLNCDHIYHLECITKVENNLCPLCRKTIVKEDVCKGHHIVKIFYTGNYKKNGECIFCLKKSFKFYLKQKCVTD